MKTITHPCTLIVFLLGFFSQVSWSQNRNICQDLLDNAKKVFAKGKGDIAKTQDYLKRLDYCDYKKDLRVERQQLWDEVNAAIKNTNTRLVIQTKKALDAKYEAIKALEIAKSESKKADISSKELEKTSRSYYNFYLALEHVFDNPRIAYHIGKYALDSTNNSGRPNHKILNILSSVADETGVLHCQAQVQSNDVLALFWQEVPTSPYPHLFVVSTHGKIQKYSVSGEKIGGELILPEFGMLNTVGVSVSNNGRFIAYPTLHGAVIVYDLNTNKKHYQTMLIPGALLSLALANNGEYLAVGSSTQSNNRKAVTIFDASGVRLTGLNFLFEPVHLDIGNSGKLIVSDGKKHAQFFESNAKKSQWKAVDDFESVLLEQKIHTPSFSSNDRIWLHGDNTFEVSVMNASNPQPTQRLKKHQNSISAIGFHEGLNLIITGSNDKSICTWQHNDERWELYQTLRGHTSQIVYVAAAPSSGYLGSLGSDGNIKIWNLEGKRRHQHFPSVAKDIFSMAYSPDGKYLVLGSADDHGGAIEVLDSLGKKSYFAGYTTTRTTTTKMDTIISIQFLSNRVFLSAHRSGKINLWSINYNSTTKQTKVAFIKSEQTANQQDITRVALSKQKGLLAVATKNGEVLLYKSDAYQFSNKIDNFKYIVSHTTQEDVLLGLGFSDEYLMVVVPNRILYFKYNDTYDVDSPTRHTYAFEKTYTLKTDEVSITDYSAVAFSPTGDTLALSIGHDIEYFDLKQATLIGKILDNGHRNRVTALEFTTNGKYLLSASWDKTAIVWNTADLKRLFIVGDPKGGAIRSICSSPSGSSFGTGQVGSLDIWRMPLAYYEETMGKIDLEELIPYQVLLHHSVYEKTNNLEHILQAIRQYTQLGIFDSAEKLVQIGLNKSLKDEERSFWHLQFQIARAENDAAKPKEFKILDPYLHLAKNTIVDETTVESLADYLFEHQYWAALQWYSQHHLQEHPVWAVSYLYIALLEQGLSTTPALQKLKSLRDSDMLAQIADFFNKWAPAKSDLNLQTYYYLAAYLASKQMLDLSASSVNLQFVITANINYHWNLLQLPAKAPNALAATNECLVLIRAYEPTDTHSLKIALMNQALALLLTGNYHKAEMLYDSLSPQKFVDDRFDYFYQAFLDDMVYILGADSTNQQKIIGPHRKKFDAIRAKLQRYAEKDFLPEERMSSSPPPIPTSNNPQVELSSKGGGCRILLGKFRDQLNALGRQNNMLRLGYPNTVITYYKDTNLYVVHLQSVYTKQEAQSIIKMIKAKGQTDVLLEEIN